MRECAEIVAEHYQNTYQRTQEMWEQRNTTFVTLLVVVGTATVLTFDVPEAQPLLVDMIASMVGISDDPGRVDELRRQFPYGLIQSVLLMIIQYLMVILYHRTASIQRCYAYLSAIEPELRQDLELAPETVAFTREGAFYVRHKSPFSRYVGVIYIAMLGPFLLSFLSVRIWTDFASGNLALGLIDLALAGPTLLFFVAYVRCS